MKKEQNKNSLGFIFSYKASSLQKNETGNTLVTVSFQSGTSHKFPNKFKHFKDFWAQEIFEGQFSEIYINPTKFIEVFNREFNEFKKDINDEYGFFKELFIQRKYSFNYPITIEQYGALYSFSSSHLYVNMYQKWENDIILTDSLKSTVGQVFKNDTRNILEIYNDYKKVSSYLYDKELGESLGEVVNVKKNKM